MGKELEIGEAAGNTTDDSSRENTWMLKIDEEDRTERAGFSPDQARNQSPSAECRDVQRVA